LIDIGARIKELREERRITGKELAERIGVSPSQMTRIEKGQRRVDSEVIARLAEVLDLSPAAFFAADAPEADALSPKRQKELGLGDLHAEIGKPIRSERRRRHLTIDDLARRTGHTKAYVLAVEEGRRSGLEGDFIRKASRLLQLDPFLLLERQESIIRGLSVRVHRLTSDAIQADPAGGGIPILLGDEADYPCEFDRDGEPIATVEGTLRIPELAGTRSFALRVRGEGMTAPPFRAGDLVVFGGPEPIRNGAFAFIRHGSDRSTFGRLFRDQPEKLRIQSLRPEVAPLMLRADELTRAWPLIAHVVIGDPRGGAS
jgi:transcriptional regulator with XRE-family HTH domain